MTGDFNRKLNHSLNRKKRRKTWHRIVSILAAVVVFCTTYALILPAITMERTLVCGKAEHVHDDSCYTEEQILVCGEEEGEGHIHTEECYDADGCLICGIDEAEEHHHTEECYKTEQVLTCGIEEHQHSDECYEASKGDAEADLETSADWEQTFSEVKLTGKWPEDLLAIAKTQIGYQESERNYVTTEEGIQKGYTRYGAWYGDSYGDWCAMFISFCLSYADVKDFPQESNCDLWIEKLKSEEYGYYHEANTYMPKSGDLVFFDQDKDSSSDHVGIVSEVTPATEQETAKIKTIEGNSSDCVQYQEYELNNEKIMGYGWLPNNPDLQNSFRFTVETENGITVCLSGLNAALPYPSEEISMTAVPVSNEGAEELLSRAAEDSGLENGTQYLFDVQLWYDGEEVQPTGTVTLTFSGVAEANSDGIAKVFHVDEETEETTEMNAAVADNGDVVVDTDHFSVYGVVLAAAGGNITVTADTDIVWDNENKEITGFALTTTSGDNNYTYYLQYSDDQGSTWNDITSLKVKKGQTVQLYGTSYITGTPLSRQFRVYVLKDNNNTGYTESVTVYDLLDRVKPGFSDWLKYCYVQMFGGPAIPNTLEELYVAFSVYYGLPALEISTRMEDGVMYVDAVTDGAGSYTYIWQYQDENNEWQSLTSETTPTINASEIDILLHGGKNVRCLIYEGDQPAGSSNTLFVNPLREVYDAAIEEINEQLNLGNLAIGGTVFNNYFYYTEVAQDSRVPFYDAASYGDYLARVYIEEGLEAVQKVWNQYLYDLYDPDKNMDHDPTYGDENLSWPKSGASSFHTPATTVPKVEDLNYDFLENGVDYSNFVTGLDKSAKTIAPGDENEERGYDVDIMADVQAKANGPVAIVLQIQTSWQMFDLNHANALAGVGDTDKGPASDNTDLATLYDIKQALIRFVDYMEENYPGNNVVLGITEFQHDGSHNIFEDSGGKDSSGSALYVSNDYEVLREAIYGWDIFGNCEHNHYDTDALEDVIENLESNLSGWEDFYGREIAYSDIQKVVVSLGGATELSSGTNGYGLVLPWTTFKSDGVNSVYGIRTNEGTPLNSDGLISWIDHPDNNTGAAYNDGEGSSFTGKYIATNEDAILNSLIEIAIKEMRKNAIEITAEDKFVDDVTVTDVVSDEFVMDYSEPIIATIYNKDGTVFDKKEISPDDENLEIIENADGTTTVTYNFGRVYNKKKCTLHFRIQAKEDYIGSNNVYSNVGTPDASYVHKVIDSAGDETGEVENYTVPCFDTPQVNVPIRFTTTDGDSTSIWVGDSVDLAHLSEEIVKDAEDRVDNYNQINGELSYVWVLPDGTEVEAGSVSVRNGSIGDAVFPDRSYDFTGTVPGEYTGTLKVTFTPEAVDPGNQNFSDEDTAVPVAPRTEPGNVWINVVENNQMTELLVRKVWVSEPPDDVDEIEFRLFANGDPVRDDEGNVVTYTVSAAENWEKLITGLPLVKEENGTPVILEYSVQETSLPDEYSAVYSKEQQEKTTYAAQAIFSIKPQKNADDATLLEIVFTYNGVSYLREFSISGLKNNTTYNYTVTDLPVDENNQPYDCSITSVTAYKIHPDGRKEVKNIGTATTSVQMSVYESGTEYTDVLVITNIKGVALPETGGRGIWCYTFGGLILIFGALMCRFIQRRKRGRGAAR